MTSDDAPPPSRRAMRDQSEPAASDSAHHALTWVDETSLLSPAGSADLTDTTAPYLPVAADLLVDAPREGQWRGRVLASLAIVAVLVITYSTTMLLWPLDNVAPTAAPAEIETNAAPVADLSWPSEGSSAVAVDGLGDPAASSDEVSSIASVTKVVTALLVLDEMPLALGEQGPEYFFTAQDSADYWEYRFRDESALDVPVGGALTEYQLLQGMLIGSANNYADRLAQNIWPSDEAFAAAAAQWLDQHDVPGVTIVDPTGIEPENAASAGALIALAEQAMQNPVIAEIVGTATVDLPGAGTVENTNELVDDKGMLGIKTGTLIDAHNLLSAKQISVGATTVRMYASVLGQPSDDARNAATRALFNAVQQQLQPTMAVPSGTVAGSVTTAWGVSVPVVTAREADVVLWNGAAATTEASIDLGTDRADGDVVGSLAVTGPLDAATIDLELDGDIEGPDAWWRLTHPLELFGFAG